MNDDLEAIRSTKGVPVLWRVCDTVLPKDHGVLFELEYIIVDEELVMRLSMVLAIYSGPRDEATADDIHVYDRTAVYHTDNKIFSGSFPISSVGALCGCIPIVLSKRVTDS